VRVPARQSYCVRPTTLPPSNSFLIYLKKKGVGKEILRSLDVTPLTSFIFNCSFFLQMFYTKVWLNPWVLSWILASWSKDWTSLDPDYSMASLDVTSVHQCSYWISFGEHFKWEFISHNTLIPLQEFKDAVKFVLNSIFFTFNNICYKQIYGTPMGSPVSLVIADLVLQDLEKLTLKSLPFNHSFVLSIVM